MIILETTTESLELITSNTNAIDVIASFADHTSSTFSAGSQEANITTATTTTIVSAPAASTQRQIKSILIENKGASSNTLTLRKNISGVFYNVCSFVLATNEDFTYCVDGKWDIHTADGSYKIYQTSATFENYISSNKQKISFLKTAARTTVAASSFSVFDLAGNPGAGVLAGTSTTAGVVPTDATAGTPLINTFTASTGYIGSIKFTNTVASRLTLFDMLFKAGAYSFAAGTTTLSAQPSYASRIPSSSNYNDTEIWIEVSTAFVTGTAWQVQVTYTNQSGTTGRTSVILPATTAANLTLGRMYQLGLQSGDTGVQKIESVIVTNGGTAMTAGAFNVLVLRRLANGRINIANGTDKQGLSDTGMPQVFADSALFLKVDADSTSTGVPEVFMDIIG